MRRNFISLEQTQEDTPIRFSVSLEEEALIEDQAHDDATVSEQDLSEAERILEVSDALEDLAVVADRIEEATPTEVSLIDTAAQMAVAGTDVPPDELVPSLESFKVGGKISTESIRERAGEIWRTIIAFLKRVWERIVAFFRINVVAQSELVRLNILERKLKNKDEHPNTEKHEKHSGFKTNLSFLGRAVENAGDVQRALTSMTELAKYVYETYPKDAEQYAELVTTQLGKVKAGNATEVAVGLREELIKPSNCWTSPPHSKEVNKGHDMTEFVSQSMLAGGNLVLKTFVFGDDDSVLGVLEHIRNSGLTYVAEVGYHHQRSLLQHTPFKVPSPGEALKLVGLAKGLLEIVIRFHKDRLDKLEKVGDNLRSASEKAATQIDTKQVQDAGTVSEVDHYRSMVNFNAAYARWVHTPAIPFYQKILTTVRIVKHLTSVTLKVYDDKDADAAEKLAKEEQQAKDSAGEAATA